MFGFLACHQFAVDKKIIGTHLPALTQVAGGLLLALPLYLLTWASIDGQWPDQLPLRSVASIIYLGVIATTLGFSFYYYLLTRLAATRVALITMISPVLALWLGHTINHEPLTIKIVAGTLLIMTALLAHEFFDHLGLLKRRRTK